MVWSPSAQFQVPTAAYFPASRTAAHSSARRPASPQYSAPCSPRKLFPQMDLASHPLHSPPPRPAPAGECRPRACPDALPALRHACSRRSCGCLPAQRLLRHPAHTDAADRSGPGTQGSPRPTPGHVRPSASPGRWPAWPELFGATPRSREPGSARTAHLILPHLRPARAAGARRSVEERLVYETAPRGGER